MKKGIKEMKFTEDIAYYQENFKIQEKHKGLQEKIKRTSSIKSK